ncbi:MAG TPA: YbhB/YbcL family Raf kinase inhibitor-like protein [Stellaceae bacterium]|nr:YbhB/YbcL family Raf kinase inhibitor-like protein [Stellaceae bacterium]
MAALPRRGGRFSTLPAVIAGVALFACTADRPATAAVPRLTVTSASFKNGAQIPGEYAFCIPAKQGHFALGPDKSPALQWSAGPAGTRSYAIIASDTDVPSVGDDVNKEGKTIPRSLKRATFYHWVLFDIPASTTSLAAGADSEGVTPHGKSASSAKLGTRGINDYTGWFASDPNMKGDYAGYDGPCPPWNDSLVHHYHFAVYALDVPTLGLKGRVNGEEAMAAIAKHTLAKGEIVGTYTLNPALGKKASSP